MLPELEARRALNSGALKQVLRLYAKIPAVYGIYLSRDYQPSALPLFLEAIQQQLSRSARAVYTYSFNVKRSETMAIHKKGQAHWEGI